MLTTGIILIVAGFVGIGTSAVVGVSKIRADDSFNNRSRILVVGCIVVPVCVLVLFTGVSFIVAHFLYKINDMLTVAT